MLRSQIAMPALPPLAVLSLFILSLSFRAHEESPDIAAVAAVMAGGAGNPYINFTDGTWLPAHATSGNGLALERALRIGTAQPASIATGDFDEDGVADLVTGYSIRSTGMVGVQRGNVDALYPYSRDVAAKRDAGTLIEAPFFANMVVARINTRPDFLASGDFDADGHLDLVAGSRLDDKLSWLPGNGDGSFDDPQDLALPGFVSALIVADVNRRDGLADVIVGIASDDPAVLVFEGPEGAMSREPERLDLDAPPSAIVAEYLDNDTSVDIAVASGDGIIVFAGRDRKLPATEEWAESVLPMNRFKKDVGSPVETIAAGRFTGGVVRDIAIIAENGDVSILQGDTRELLTTPYGLDLKSTSEVPLAITSKVSSLQGDELVILDRGNRKVNILHAEHFAFARAASFFPESTPMALGYPEPISFLVDADPVAIQAFRMNGDALGDLAILSARQNVESRSLLSNVAVTSTAPMNTFTVDTDAGGVTSWDNNPGDGICATKSGGCTFNAAIREANALAGHDMILFSINELTAVAWMSGVHIEETVTIDGTGQGRVIASGQSSMSMIPPATAVTIRGLALNGNIQINGDLTNGTKNLIENNWVGLNGDGSGPASDLNSSWRIEIYSGGNVIGGPSPEARNVMQGLTVKEADNMIVGNYIATTANGEAALERSLQITIYDAANTTFGGAEPGTGNVVGDRYTDIRRSDGLLFQGNLLGTNAKGTSVIDMDDHFSTLSVLSSNGATVGGTAPGAKNVITGIGGSGLYVGGSGNVVVQGNLIGTDITGTDSLGNEESGLEVYECEGALIGGAASGARNIISGNHEEGLLLKGGIPALILGNVIGMDATGTRKLGNRGAGVVIDGPGWILGGSGKGEGNIVAGNNGDGVIIKNIDAKVIGNFIGTNQYGAELGNARHGVYVESGPRGTVIGGREAGEANTIAFSGGDGIRVDMDNRDVTTWYNNSIHSNAGLGINLHDRDDDDTGVTPNDPNDNDSSGPNNYQNFPELVKNADGTIQITLDTDEDTAYDIEFFGNAECDPTGHGEGQFYLFSESMTTDADGIATISRPIATIAGRQFVTAVAIDPEGRASEFSMCAEAEAAPAWIVEVRSDSLGSGTAPLVKNTAFDVFKVDWSDPENFFLLVGTRVTDNDGRLMLDPTTFSAGEEFMLALRVDEKLSPKQGREDVNSVAYKTIVDNLIVDRVGGIRADVLASSTDVVTTSYLGHMTVVFNLIVSIEWAANDAYVENLADALGSTANYLFDVTNGQARLGEIAIYDNKKKWNSADIRIHASNLQWPMASISGITKVRGHLDMPPKHFGGSKSTNINKMYSDMDLNVWRTGSVRTFGHEFGHFGFGLYDEYEGKPAGSSQTVSVHRGTNFSFMDNQFGSDKMASEMSALVALSTSEKDKFKDTEHYQLTGQQDGWTTFRSRFSTTNTADVPADVHTPERVGVSYPDVITGPNDNLSSPNFRAQHLIDVTMLDVSHKNDPRLEYVAKFRSTGLPAPGIEIDIIKQIGEEARYLRQGKTVLTGPDKGKIRLLGADPLDRLIANDPSARTYTFARINIPAIATGKTQDEGIVQLEELTAGYNMLATVVFTDGGGLRYETQATTTLGAAPSIDLITDDQPIESINLDGGPADYSVDLPGFPDADAVLLLNGQDGDGTEFPVPQSLSMFEIDTSGTMLVPTSAGLEMTLDPELRDIDRLAVLSSPFPAPETGLPDSVLRVSPVFGVSTSPSNGEFRAKFEVYFNADSLFALAQEGVTIYRWAEGWTPLPTVVIADTLVQTAVTEIDEAGFYVAYMDLRLSTTTAIETDEIPDHGDSGTSLRNYPNPFASETRIPLRLETAGVVGMTVFNVLGQEVGRVVPRLMQAGDHELHINAVDLSPGTYVYVVMTGDRRLSGVMLVAK
ncbi:FG-GAP-like repeat-containing protein [Bacteroidota bacterium]